MHLSFRNVNQAFHSILTGIMEGDYDGFLQESGSRVGPIVTFTEPITITYEYPMERVLFFPGRDANPFFHLFESVWMLAGKDSLAPLTKYIKDFGKFSDDGQTLHGAYGHRWRNYFGVDQLRYIIEALQTNKEDRRIVLTMWSPWNCEVKESDKPVLREGDMLKSLTGGKDVPCNTHAYFRVRSVDNFDYLDMTVCNRSNDLVWGCFGANVVHFSILQEFLARAMSMEVGKYHQITNNLHYYTAKERWNPSKWLEGYWHGCDLYDPHAQKVNHSEAYPILLTDDEEYEMSVSQFLEECEALVDNEDVAVTNIWLKHVVSPMMLAHRHYRENDFTKAMEALQLVWASDWQTAGYTWLTKRKLNYKKKAGTS